LPAFREENPMARRRRTARVAALLAAAAFAPALLVTPTATAVERNIAYVSYFSDATLSTLVGSRTWNNCPGEEGTWGWGLQTAYHIITSEPC
jgi:hypothetical protein